MSSVKERRVFLWRRIVAELLDCLVFFAIAVAFASIFLSEEVAGIYLSMFGVG